MSTTPTTASPVGTPQGSVRNWLIGGLLMVAAAIIFGLLYLFVIAPSVPNGSVGWYLFSFATGLTMIVMPCTLPLAFVIVPLSMGKGMIKGISMALAFGLGVAFTLSMYGVAAALLGGFALDALGADIESIKNWVYFGAGTFALLFALSEIGLLNFHMPTYSGAAPAFIQKRQEILKAFFLGAFLGNVGVGCPHPATPLILIEIATSGDVLYGWTMFLIHAIGRVLPLLLLAFLAILGVNGLNWLMARKDAVERATGWAMVFVAGFILTLGLFSHDWWVNSGIHSGLEAITQEAKMNTLMNETLGTAVAHVHGLETGEGLFGLPLEWGNWFLVTVWLIPMWWWYSKRRKQLQNSPAFRLQALEAQIDKLEKNRRQIESMMNIDDLETSYDLAQAQAAIDAIEKTRREEEGKVQFGESGVMKEPIARTYEQKILRMQRSYIMLVSVVLILLFVHFIPTNFYLKNSGGDAAHHGAAPATTGSITGVQGTPFDTSIAGLPDASDLQFVELNNGDSYTVTASYVKKEIGNRMLRMLAYNGSIPGPFIKVTQGSTVTINFVNNTDTEQTIHSHGLRLDNNFDGVPGVTQNVVMPGESYSYTLNFPDAGIAWYHPHTRDDYGQEMGLYGNYLVASPDANYWAPANRELPLVIDDILVENEKMATFFKEFPDHALLGRFGNEFLLNGSTDYAENIEKGEVVRLSLTNASNARTYRLSLPGAQMKVVGSEWSRYMYETYTEELIISPAERYVVDVYFPKAGKVKLQNRMKNSSVTIGEFNVSDTEVSESHAEAFRSARRNDAEIAEFAAFKNYSDAAPQKKLTLSVALTGNVDHGAHAHQAVAPDAAAHDHGSVMPMMGNAMDAMEWGDTAQNDAMNTTKNVEWIVLDEATGKKGMNIPVSDWTFKQGSLVKMRITNDMMAAHIMQHPIHIHGQRFVVLAENGIPNKNMAWKDTALVPPAGYIDILVEMSNLGEWMLHCHISEHLHAGMMMPFRVENASGYATGDEFRASVKPASAPQVINEIEGKSYSFTDTTDETIKINIDLQKVIVKKNTLLALSFDDAAGNPVNLSSSIDRPLKVTFVKSDNSESIVTYPGNTNFPESVKSAPTPATMPAKTPSSDGHDHLHFLGINEAYAHGGVDDGHMMAKTYSVPVQFTSVGAYKGFVEFIVEGETTPRVATVQLEVVSDSFNIDNYGMTPNMKWWVLLIISLVLMTPLVIWVRKYINA